MTDPLGNDEVHTFGPVINSATGQPDSGSYETQVQTYSGSAITGNLLRTVNKDYLGEIATQQPDAADHGMINVRLIRTTTTLEDGTQLKKETDYETFQQQFTSPTYLYTVTRLNPLETREYAYGAGASGPLLRRTDFTYLHTGNANYLSRNIVHKVLSTTVYDGSGTQVAKTVNEYDNYTHSGLPMVASNTADHDATNYGTTFIYRGNVTAKSVWRNTDNAMLTTVNQYDDAGSVISATDPLSHKTTYDYTDSWSNAACAPSGGGQSKAFVTKITDALALTTTKSYNSCTGSLASVTDANGKVTSRTYDLMDRSLQVSLPDGGQTTFCYSDVTTALGGLCYDANPSIKVITKEKITSSLSKVQTHVFDTLGRPSQAQLNSDPSGVTYLDTTYDVLGRKSTESNPYRKTTDSTYGLTTYSYDALDRVTSVVRPDNSNTMTTYAGHCTTVSDETGKTRRTCSDGLGRLSQVLEDTASANYETDYVYDTLGNMTCAEQHGGLTGTGCSSPVTSDATSPWRVRRFTYNSLSQLLNATNPESGTLSYTYDSGGNVLTKVAPKPNQTGTATTTTTYVYDAVNRLTKKTYNDGTTPTVQYGYDGAVLTGCTTAPPAISTPTNLAGRRSSMCDGSGASSWSYDAVGRSLIESRITQGVSSAKAFNYTYNSDGSMASLNYPSGRTITYTPNAAARISAAVDATSNINYVTGAYYTAFGALSGLVNGSSSSFAGITTTENYNVRLQPRQISATTPTATVMRLTYDFHVGASDNGNVYQVANNKDTNRTQNFQYDALNRIKQASTLGPNWGETFTIDAWGNLTNKGPVTGKTLTESLNAAPATLNNRLTGFGYDAAGNMTSNGSATYTYDAENRLVATAGWTYLYDGDGVRVKKSSSASNGTVYWSGAGSEALWESDPGGSLRSEYIFFNGRRVARRDSSGAVHYYLSDLLGSADVITDSAGVIQEESDYFPYGGEVVISNGDPNNYKFTGKERDAESGLDNFGARFYGSSLGRFMTPDWAARPVAVPYAGFGDPQSLNLYTYVENSPVNRADVDGHVCGGYGVAGATVPKSTSPCVENTGSQQTPATPAPEKEAEREKDAQKRVAQNAELQRSQLLKGGGKLLLGGGLIATVAVGDVPGGFAGGAIVASALLTGITTSVSGVADVAGGLTKTDVHEATEVLDATSNLPGLAMTVGTGFNLKAGQTAAVLSDVATLAGSPREAFKNPATVVDSIRTVGDAYDLAKTTTSSAATSINNGFRSAANSVNAFLLRLENKAFGGN